jgi:SAM-dependent methyltransferase
MGNSTENERNLYGREWNHVHHGYFSDPSVAVPLMDALVDAIGVARPHAVVDLGGGTGFILKRLEELGASNGAVLINVDVSADQLCQTQDSHIVCVSRFIEEVLRMDLCSWEEPLLLCMRSVLHYFGKEGLKPLLRHLRALMREGEYLVHQTACFEDRRDQEVMNLLYEGMGTGKWYPGVDELITALEGQGWKIHTVNSARSLVLPKDELIERYKVGEMEMAGIKREIMQKGKPSPAVFISSDQGFTAYLHYRVFKCEAV